MHSTSTVRAHYDSLLAPIYAWMLGDLEVAQARAHEEISRLAPFPTGATAVDLGAGLGLHARALRDAGHDSVWMIDTSAYLLGQARDHADRQRIHSVEGDLTSFDAHVDLPVDTILCMGDTLTHLPSREAVQALLTKVTAALKPGGVFLATLRDYTHARTGTDRFLPVRSDETRILTVFLEHAPETVTVHDILQERQEGQWSLRVGSYPKLRLDPAWIHRLLRDRGLAVETDAAPGGLVRITARRPSSATMPGA